VLVTINTTTHSKHLRTRRSSRINGTSSRGCDWIGSGKTVQEIVEASQQGLLSLEELRDARHNARGVDSPCGEISHNAQKGQINVKTVTESKLDELEVGESILHDGELEGGN